MLDRDQVLEFITRALNESFMDKVINELNVIKDNESGTMLVDSGKIDSSLGADADNHQMKSKIIENILTIFDSDIVNSHTLSFNNTKSVSAFIESLLKKLCSGIINLNSIYQLQTTYHTHKLNNMKNIRDIQHFSDLYMSSLENIRQFYEGLYRRLRSIKISAEEAVSIAAWIEYHLAIKNNLFLYGNQQLSLILTLFVLTRYNMKLPHENIKYKEIENYSEWLEHYFSFFDSVRLNGDIPEEAWQIKSSFPDNFFKQLKPTIENSIYVYQDEFKAGEHISFKLQDLELVIFKPLRILLHEIILKLTTEYQMHNEEYLRDIVYLAFYGYMNNSKYEENKKKFSAYLPKKIITHGKSKQLKEVNFSCLNIQDGLLFKAGNYNFNNLETNIKNELIDILLNDFRLIQ